jgi:hypothetical protein
VPVGVKPTLLNFVTQARLWQCLCFHLGSFFVTHQRLIGTEYGSQEKDNSAETCKAEAKAKGHEKDE